MPCPQSSHLQTGDKNICLVGMAVGSRDPVCMAMAPNPILRVILQLRGRTRSSWHKTLHLFFTIALLISSCSVSPRANVAGMSTFCSPHFSRGRTLSLSLSPKTGLVFCFCAIYFLLGRVKEMSMLEMGTIEMVLVGKDCYHNGLKT